MTFDAALDTRLWHPFSQMSAVSRDEFLVTKAEDVWVWDDEGKKYLDGTASLWYSMIGHGRPEMADAIAKQIKELDAFMVFSDYANPPALELANLLADLAPMDDATVYLGLGGGDAIETAVKLARFYFSSLGEPQRTHVIARTDAYHGMHGYGTSLVGTPGYKVGMGPIDPATSNIQFDSVEALEAEIDRLGPGKVAAVIAEPVLGAGGVRAAPEGYFQTVREICDRTGALLIIDEVICGFGRMGHWFASERLGIEPDLLCFAKGVTSGYMPLGGVLVSGKVGAPFYDGPDAPVFSHGLTFTGHPAGCAAALENIAILDREGLIGQGRALEGRLADAVNAAAGDSSLVGEVRAGLGLMAAMEIDADVAAEKPETAMRLFHAVRRHGVLLRPLGDCLAISPPLTIQEEHFELLTSALSQALADVEAGVEN